MLKNNTPIVKIENINKELYVEVSSVLMSSIESYQVNRDFNYVVLKFTPKSQEEVSHMLQLTEALKGAGYFTVMLAVIDNEQEWTPYYLKVEWNMDTGEG